MVYSSASLDATFGALADPTRREILTRLATGDRTISELASRFDMTLPGVSKHIMVLQRAGLAHVERDGRVRRASLRAAPLRAADEWIERYRSYWETQLDMLAKYLEDPASSPSPTESSWQPTSPRSRHSKSGGRSARHGSASSTRGRKRKK
jgi:DNA-binding transcriptional ArsR family regulator